MANPECVKGWYFLKKPKNQTVKQIYLIQRWDPNYSEWTGSNVNEEILPKIPKLEPHHQMQNTIQSPNQNIDFYCGGMSFFFMSLFLWGRWCLAPLQEIELLFSARSKM